MSWSNTFDHNLRLFEQYEYIIHIDFKLQQYLTDVNYMTCLLLYGKDGENLKMPNHDGIAKIRKTGLFAFLFLRSTCDYKRSTPKDKSLMSAKQW